MPIHANPILHSKHGLALYLYLFTASSTNFKNLWCVFTRNWPISLKAEWGNLGRGYQIFAQVCTSPLLLCAGMCQLRSCTSGKPTLLQLSVPIIYWEIFPTSPCSPLLRTDWHAQGRTHPTFPFCRTNSGRAVMSAYCTAILDSVISQSTFITLKSLACLSWDVQIYPSDITSSLHETLPCCFSFPFFLCNGWAVTTRIN